MKSLQCVESTERFVRQVAQSTEGSVVEPHWDLGFDGLTKGTLFKGQLLIVSRLCDQLIVPVNR